MSSQATSREPNVITIESKEDPCRPTPRLVTDEHEDQNKDVYVNQRFNEPMLVFHQEGSPEWKQAWKGLYKVAGCVVAKNPATGERWEYVGTYQGFHEFRHKMHPEAGQRLYARVPVEGSSEKGHVWTGIPYMDMADPKNTEIHLDKECPLQGNCI